MIPEKISAWCREYGVPEERLEFGYADLGLTCAGRTLFWPSSIRASITVHEAVRGSVCEEEVMWHEYCHWEEGWRYGHMSDHGERWKELYGRRSYPWYLRIVESFLLILYRIHHRNHLIGEPRYFPPTTAPRVSVLIHPTRGSAVTIEQGDKKTC